jgi:uncharacterized membrane protein YcfT
MAALFAATDGFCPHGGFPSFLAALGGGALVGWIAHRLDLERFATCFLGLASMAALQWASRGGLTALHFFVFFPFASACAYLGYLREEGGQD